MKNGITYQQVADELNRKNGNNNWTAQDVETWFICNCEDDYTTIDEIVDDIIASGN